MFIKITIVTLKTEKKTVQIHFCPGSQTVETELLSSVIPVITVA